MHLFICWSGPRSKCVAVAMQMWLPKILPGLEPFLSTEIPKGSRWFEAVGNTLAKAEAGLICLTLDNLQSPWIHFEAGALAKQMAEQESRIYTYLCAVEPAEINGPLAAYQSTTNDKEDTKRLLQAMVGWLAYTDDWEPVFEENWPMLEQAMSKPLDVQALIPRFEEIFQRKTYNEPVDECTAQNWIDRYDGARETYERLKSYERTVKQNCPHLADLYNELLAQADGYAMDISALLLKPEQFKLDIDGKLAIVPPGILVACEKRRKLIKELIAAMLDPMDRPMTREAWRYKNASSLAEKKALIHRKEREIKERPAYQSDDLNSYLTSSWDFDRIVYYLVQEYLPQDNRSQVQPATQIDNVKTELETLEAQEGPVSLMPLHYAVRALYASLRFKTTKAEEVAQVRDVLQRVEAYVKADKERDAGGQLRRNLDAVRNQLNMRLSSDTPTTEGDTAMEKS